MDPWDRAELAIVFLLPECLAAIGLWLIRDTNFAVVLFFVGVNVSLSLEIFRRFTRERTEPDVWQTTKEIEKGYVRMFNEAETECFFTWTANYPSDVASTVLDAEGVALTHKGQGFRLVRLVGRSSTNWSEDGFNHHLSDRKFLITRGVYDCRWTASSGFEIGYADYKGADGRPHFRAAINFLLPNGTPHMAMSFDSSKSTSHERAALSIRSLFEVLYADSLGAVARNPILTKAGAQA